MGPPSPPYGVDSSYEEGVLLGRRSVIGAANATSLASLVRSLRVGSPATLRRGLQAFRLRCHDQGLEIRGPRYDEGFESDDTESTRSGGDTEERGDTSSGVSDGDDTSDSLVRLSPLRELYSIRDVVFCHGDPTFPRIVVWVVNASRRPSKPGYLEALVFECRSESAVRHLCTSYQDISRRYKLDQYSYSKRKENHNHKYSLPNNNAQHEFEYTKSSFTKEMEGVTGVESLESFGPVLGRRRERNIIRQREPPSLLILPAVAVNPSELHKVWKPATKEEKKEEQEEEPPKRPERRRYLRKNQKNTSSSQDDSNVMRGQLVRVNVDAASPQQMLLKPQFTWMYGVPATAEMVLTTSSSSTTTTTSQQQQLVPPHQHHHRSRRSCRSVSPTMSRRRLPPMQHRYGVDTHLSTNINNNNNQFHHQYQHHHLNLSTTHRLVQGLSQKLRELNPVGGTLKHTKKFFNANNDVQPFTTLKPVIKKSSKRFGAGEMGEPKKVTFSAYATVQVVD